jgi:zinc protease
VTQISAQMLLKGTKKRAAAYIASELENRGGSLMCTADAHRYMIGADVMRGDETGALDLLADLILHPALPQAQLADVKKRQIASIVEEKEDPLTVAMRKARREIFAGQPFHRTALGTEQSVAALKITDCRAMLHASFATGNGVVSVFGDVKAAEVKKQVEKAFGKLPRGPRQIAHAREYHASAKPAAWTEHLDKEQAVIVVGFRTVGLEDRDVHALNLIDEACSDMGSRLFNRIREELGLAYYVGAQNFAAMGAGAFYFYVGTDPKKVKLAEKELMAQINDLAANGLTPKRSTVPASPGAPPGCARSRATPAWPTSAPGTKSTAWAGTTSKNSQASWPTSARRKFNALPRSTSARRRGPSSCVCCRSEESRSS